MRTFLLSLLAVVAVLLLTLFVIHSDLVGPQFVVREEAKLKASSETTWRKLSNFKQYSDWNPYLTQIDGKFSVGEQLQVSLNDGNFDGTVVVTPHLSEIVIGEYFCWAGTLVVPGLFDTRHCFVIHDEGNNSRIEQFEEFKGLIPMLFSVEENMAPHVRVSFKRMHEALAQTLQEENVLPFTKL
ncbi:MAG: hypothetical protein AB8B48_10775 [Pseudomonadales bacterium]